MQEHTCIFVNWNWSKNLRSLPHINRRHTCFSCCIGSCSSFFILFSFDVVFFFIEHKVRKHAAAIRYRRQPWEANDVGQTSRLHGRARDAHSSMSNHFKKPTRSLSFVCVVSGAWRFYRGEGSHMSDEICLLCLFLWQIWPFWFQLTFFELMIFF